MNKGWWLVMLAAAGCKPPVGAAVTSCEVPLLKTGAARDCTVEVVRFEGPTSAWFSTDSKNRKAKVRLELQVAKGQVKATVRRFEGEPLAFTVGQAPQVLELETSMGNNQRFELALEPLGAAVEGLTGTVNYSSP